jgi:hypothetical protein
MTRIILVEPVPEPQRNVAPAPMVSAKYLMFTKGGLSKMSRTQTVYYFSDSILHQLNSEEIRIKNSPNPYVYFCLVGLVYSKVGAGAA